MRCSSKVKEKTLEPGRTSPFTDFDIIALRTGNWNVTYKKMKMVKYSLDFRSTRKHKKDAKMD